MATRVLLVLCTLIALGAGQRFDSAPRRRPPGPARAPPPIPVSTTPTPATPPPPPPLETPTAAPPLPPPPAVLARSAACERKFARFPVPGQCDAYVECRNYMAYDMKCPDGLHFNPEAALNMYPCGYPLDVPCKERAGLQPAHPTADCPHRFGYFKMGDPQTCGSYRVCVDGHAYSMQCATGLAWNQDAYKCDWPDQVPGCDVEAFLGFRCPAFNLEDNDGRAVVDRFYSHPTSCFMYFDCEFDRPRLLTCAADYAFDQVLGRCVDAETVSSCRRTRR